MLEEDTDIVKRRKTMSEETKDLMYREEDSVLPRLRQAEKWQRERQQQINKVRNIIRTIFISGVALGAASALGWFAVQKLLMG